MYSSNRYVLTNKRMFNKQIIGLISLNINAEMVIS